MGYIPQSGHPVNGFVSSRTKFLAKSSQRTDHITLVVFPAFARSIHSFAEYDALVPKQALKAEKIDGIGICGLNKLVRSFAGSLKLLR